MISDGKVRLCQLREYRTSNGKPYMRGYIGDAKVLLFRDDQAEKPGGCEAVWSLYIEQAERAGGSRPRSTATNNGGSRFQSAPVAGAQGGQRMSWKRNRHAATTAGPAPDDPLDDILPAAAE